MGVVLADAGSTPAISTIYKKRECRLLHSLFFVFFMSNKLLKILFLHKINKLEKLADIVTQLICLAKYIRY